VQVRRVYEETRSGDGLRILVDRMWPRGLRKDAAGLDEWAKDPTSGDDGHTRASLIASSQVRGLWMPWRPDFS